MHRRFIGCLVAQGDCPGRLLTGRILIGLGKASGHYSAITCGHFLRPLIVIRCGTPRVGVAGAIFSRVTHCGVILHIRCLVIDGNLGRCYYGVSCGGQTCAFLRKVPTCGRLWASFLPVLASSVRAFASGYRSLFYRGETRGVLYVPVFAPMRPSMNSLGVQISILTAPKYLQAGMIDLLGVEPLIVRAGPFVSLGGRASIL